MSALASLLKEYAAPGSATSGLAGYDLEGQRTRSFRAALRRALRLRKGDVEGHEFHGNQWTGAETSQEKQFLNDRFDNLPVGSERLQLPVKDGVKSENKRGGFGDCTALAMKEHEASGATVYIGYVVDKAMYDSASAAHQPHDWGYRLEATAHAWNVKDGQIIDRALGSKEAKTSVYLGAKVPENRLPSSANHADLTNWEHLFAPKKLLKLLTDRAAHAAATSYLNLKPQPTEGERHAGNYPKGHLKIAGLDISIENPAGSHRRPEWSPLQSHYGYIRRTEGADGEHVDCFVRVGTPEDYAGHVHVVNQVRADGSFDEHKVILGHETSEGARQAYLENYERGWTGLGSMVSLSMDDFKAWLAEGDTTKPLADNSLSRLLLSTIRRFA